MQISSVWLSSIDSLSDSSSSLEGHGVLESDNSASWGFRSHQDLTSVHLGRGCAFFKEVCPPGSSAQARLVIPHWLPSPSYWTCLCLLPEHLLHNWKWDWDDLVKALGPVLKFWFSQWLVPVFSYTFPRFFILLALILTSSEVTHSHHIGVVTN